MANSSKLTKLIIFITFVIPPLIFAFFYLGTNQVFEEFSYEYHLIDKGDTVFHTYPSFAFQDLEGNPVGPEELKGKVCLVSFFTVHDDSFKRTTVLNGNLRRVYDNIEWEKDPPFRFISINMGDSLPDILRYEAEMGVDKKNWTILRGSQEDIYRLAMQGFVMDEFATKRPGDEPFTAQTIAMVDKEGFVRRYFVATDLGQERKLQEDLIAILRLVYPEDITRMRNLN